MLTLTTPALLAFIARLRADLLLLASAALGLCSPGYQLQIFRTAFRSVRPGKVEAGRVLGLSRGPVLARIVLSQVLRMAMGPMGFTRLQTFRYFELFLLAAILYLAVVFEFSLILSVVERLD